MSRLHRSAALLALTISLFIWGAASVQWGQLLDLKLLDNTHNFRDWNANYPIIVIEIDEQSIRQIGPWPWPRSVHAQLLRKLAPANPKHIIFDVLFPEMSDDIEADKSFAHAMSGLPQLVLPIYFAKDSFHQQALEVPPARLFYAQNPKLGHPHVDCNTDAICRSVFLKEGVGKAHWPHLTLAALSQEVDQPPGQRAQYATTAPFKIRRDFHNYIPFPNTYDGIPTVSYVDVLNRQITFNEFQHATILIGMTATGLGDVIATPSGLMPGVFVNAIIFNALESNTLIQNSHSHSFIAVASILSFVLMLTLQRLNPFAFLIGTSASLALAVGFHHLSVLIWNSQFPMACILIGLTLHYPLWSWLRLHYAFRHLKIDIRKIGEELDSHASILPGTKNTQPMRSSAIKNNTFESDIQRLAQIKKSVTKQRHLITQTLNHISDAVLVAEATGDVILHNQSARTLLNINSADGQIDNLNIYNFFKHSDCQPEWLEWLNSKTNDFLELKLLEEQTFLCTHTTTATELEPLEQHIILFSNISTLKKAQQDKLDTLHFLSHDLRAPLTSILAIVESLKPLSQFKTLGPKISRIQTYAKKNLELSENLLQLGRAEAVTRSEFQLIDAQSILDNAYYVSIDLATAKNISLVLETSHPDAWIKGSQSLLERALLNLVSNAIKYCDAKATITLSLTAEQNNVTFTIKDNGPGVLIEDQQSLFTRYKQGVNKKPHSGGAGLGLYFVKTVTDTHAGEVSFTTPVGGGSCFSMTFPKMSLEQPST